MLISVAIRTEQQTYALPPPNRHHDVIHMLAEMGHATPITGEQGFIDDQRGFVNRRDGAQIALDQKQTTGLKWPPDLFSEDLW